MDVNDAAKLLDASAKVFGALVWPVVACYILLRFGPGIGDFVASMGEITLKGAGFEASAKRRSSEATAALTAATVSRSGQDRTSEATAIAVKEAAEVAGEIDAKTIQRLAGSTVLWVDDIPKNNRYERRALEALGIQFVNSTSTEDALEELRFRKFDMIISDMGRPPDGRAGYTLLEMLRSNGDQTPFIIYSGSRSLQHQAEARRRGAIGCTNSAAELFQIVLDVLRRRSHAFIGQD